MCIFDVVAKKCSGILIISTTFIKQQNIFTKNKRHSQFSDALYNDTKAFCCLFLFFSLSPLEMIVTKMPFLLLIFYVELFQVFALVPDMITGKECQLWHRIESKHQTEIYTQVII